MFHCDFFLHSNFLPSYSVSQQFHNSRCFLVHLPWLLSLLVSHQVSKTRIKHWLQLHFVIQKNEMKIKWAPWTELSSWHSLKLIFLLAIWGFFFPEQINQFTLTRTGRLKGFLLHIHLLVMEDADPPVYLVEQGGTQIRKLAGGDERVGIEAVVGEELSEVQTLQWEGENMKI